MWQDWVLMVGGFGFSLALLPTVFSKSKPAWTTSLLTSIILLSGVGTYATLGLWKAALSGGITAVLWVILLIQALVRK